MKKTSSRSDNGFTLLEVMVSLLVATLVVGGVMGAISLSMQYSKRVKEKSESWPILEAAAQEILVHPEKAEKGSISLDDFPDTPEVSIRIAEVARADDMSVGSRYGKLYRVRLEHAKHILEFSIIIPESGLFG